MDLADVREVELEEMLAARERRVALQKSMIESYHVPVISFTLNIPGPVKVFEGIPETFDAGIGRIRKALEGFGTQILSERILRESTGHEAFFAAAASPLALKRLMTTLEDESDTGRLYDIDIIKQDGNKVSREELKLPGRACFICGRPAHECARSRNHSVEELIFHIKKIINQKETNTRNTVTKQFLDRLQEAVVRSLTDEIDATPKPGLVDRMDSGAHTDMDYETFKVSIRAISPYLREMAEVGAAFDEPDPSGFPQASAESLFHQIRPIGVQAENAMFDATGGVNTHKGIIFSMGLTAAAAGVFLRRRDAGKGSYGSAKDLLPSVKAEDLLWYCKKMCKTSMEHDFSAISPDNPKTHGELLYLKYGCGGIRKEAADGFPAVRLVGLPALREFLVLNPNALPSRSERGERFPVASEAMKNHLSLHILLKLMANVDDTNVLFRTDYASLAYVKERASSVLSMGGSASSAGMDALTQLNKDFIKRNISPGGCADLLSMTLFVRRLELIFADFDQHNE